MTDDDAPYLPGDHSPACRFFIAGLPQPGGSKRAFVVKGRAVITEANVRSKPWRDRVASAAAEAFSGPPLDGPLSLEVTFTLPRPRGHFGKRGLLASARRYPTTRPDCTKILRSTEDALKGILWVDDSIIVSQHVEKRYGDKPGAMICVRRLES